jgi:hypothetical protein
MFKSAWSGAHNEAIPAGSKPRLLRTAEPRTPSNPFARQRKSTCRDRTKRKKTLCAPREPQKVLVVELLLLYPMYRMPPTWNTVLTASSDHLKQATYSPFELPSFYN